MKTITKENVSLMFQHSDWAIYKKKRLTQAARVIGPFTVLTREGKLSCPDGYVALDSEEFPYPIAKLEFETIYKEVD